MERVAGPVLKWAGGKRALLGQFEPYFPVSYGAYHEPFVGGAAVYFHLQPRVPAHLSDINPELINFYEVLRDQVDSLVQRLAVHQQRHDAEYYYEVRRQRPTDRIERAARLGYLNKTCYNGLYRVNARGGFNVPLGRYKNPTILDEPRLRLASQALRGAELRHEPFDRVLQRARQGDFVYFDPPYHPLNATSSFTSYTKDSFGEKDQKKLARVFARLVQAGVQVMLSNSDTPLIRKLYQRFRIIEVKAPRFINSKAASRSAISELLVLGN